MLENEQCRDLTGLCGAIKTGLGRISCLPGRADSFPPFREPIGHELTTHNWQAIALPPAHSAGDDHHVVHTLPFEITGLELREGAALGDEIKRFGLQQFACADKFFG